MTETFSSESQLPSTALSINTGPISEIVVPISQLDTKTFWKIGSRLKNTNVTLSEKEGSWSLRAKISITTAQHYQLTSVVKIDHSMHLKYILGSKRVNTVIKMSWTQFL